jgi:hypothetical protein
VSSLTTRRVASLLLWSSLAVHAPIAVVGALNSRLPNADLDNYYDIGTRAGRPYVDFPVEFPVATAEVFRAVAPMAGSRARFGTVVVIANLVADAAIVAALAWGWGIGAAACYAFITIPILDLFLLRTDLWSTALATLAVAAWRRERLALTALGIAAGAAFKLWPLAFVPLLVAPIGGRVRVAPIVLALLAGALVLCGWLWVAGPLGLYQVLTFRGARGWEVESTVGSIWMAIDQSTLRVETGAWRIGSTLGPISIVMFGLGVVPCVWMIWRGARTGHLGAGWGGGIAAMLVMSALLSAQFAAWFAPAAGVAWVEKDRRVAVVNGLLVFLTNLVWKSFHPLINHETRPLLTLLLRNVVLIGFAIYTARLVAGAPLVTGSAAPSGDPRQLPA